MANYSIAGTMGMPIGNSISLSVNGWQVTFGFTHNPPSMTANDSSGVEGSSSNSDHSSVKLHDGISVGTSQSIRRRHHYITVVHTQ